MDRHRRSSGLHCCRGVLFRFYLGRSTDGLSGNQHWNHMSGPGMMGPGMMGPGMGPQHCQMAPTGQSPPPTAPPRMTPESLINTSYFKVIRPYRTVAPKRRIRA